MSKSLKDYTTIRNVLSRKEWSARSLRICFLLMPWQDGIEVTDELMTSAVMKILSDLVTESNSAEALSDQTVILLAQWATRIVTIFRLDLEGDPNDQVLQQFRTNVKALAA